MADIVIVEELSTPTFIVSEQSPPADVVVSCDQGPRGPQGPAGPQGPIGPQGPSTVLLLQYSFDEPTMEWHVNHNKNTRLFIPALFGSNGAQFFSNFRVIDENSFVVRHTVAITGYVNVLFNNPDVGTTG